MAKLKAKLIIQAKEKHNFIEPCPKCGTWTNSFTIINEKLFFWFNTEDHSTHVVSCELN